MDNTIDARSRATLDSAASRLYSMGRHHADELPASTRLNCLAAAGYLAAGGARVVAAPVTDFAGTLRAVLDDLADLPPHIFAEAEILDAARAARTALARLDEAHADLDR